MTADEENWPVRFDSTRPPDAIHDVLVDVIRRATQCNGDVSAALALSAEVGQIAPHPGEGNTAGLWEILATVAAVDVGVARVLEPHLDALSILSQAGSVDLGQVAATPESTWGVYAAEGQEAPLAASVSNRGWQLTGSKPWCSLARDVSHALITAQTADGKRQLFAVNMKHSGVHPMDAPWISRGLRQIVSTSVRFEAVPAMPVGDGEWYLTRPGFAWGGIGVAACWLGGAIGVARLLYRQAIHREPDQIGLAHVGIVDTALNAGRATMREAGLIIDDPSRSDVPAAILARRVRNLVADVAERVLTHVGHASGPGPLTVNETHARRAADLQIYIRQHHAERDHASLGRDVLRLEKFPW